VSSERAALAYVPATAGMTAIARRKRAAAKIMMNCVIAFA
jgi:hypothetical protein